MESTADMFTFTYITSTLDVYDLTLVSGGGEGGGVEPDNKAAETVTAVGTRTFASVTPLEILEVTNSRCVFGNNNQIFLASSRDITCCVCGD